jgi:nucleoside 2-deoxyribosyltransferase
LQHIRECEFLIADLSLERPNVYYEIGYAHAIGRHPILFRRKGTPLHFDLSIHMAREFENMTELEKKLESYFEEALGRKAK